MLVVSRGGSVKDRRQHEGLLQLHREMQVGYCRLATISTDNLSAPRVSAASAPAAVSLGPRAQDQDLDIAESPPITIR